MQLIDFLDRFQDMEHITIRNGLTTFFEDKTAKYITEYMYEFKCIERIAYIREIRFYSIYTYIKIM